MEPQPVAGEVVLGAEDVVPEPLADVGLVVDQENAEGGGRYLVDPPDLPHVDALEHAEQRDGGENRQYLIGIGNEEIVGEGQPVLGVHEKQY